MKVRVSIPGAYMVAEMEEGQAHRIFRKVVELLCISGIQSEEEPKPEKMPPSFPETITMLSSTLGPEEKYVSGENQEPAIPSCSIGYGGFLYIKCPDCGNVKGFCAKARLSNFRCDCGSVTKLSNLVPLYVNCECGRNSRYLTNIKDPVFDIICYDCGNPVAVSWNPHKKQYETIRD